MVEIKEKEWTHIRIRVETKNLIDRRKPKTVSYDSYIAALSHPEVPTPRTNHKGTVISIWPPDWFVNIE
jgi:hypothetical protein